MELVVPTEVYARVVGYYRSVKSWNDGKQKEWESRKLCQVSNTPKKQSTH